MPRPTSKGVTIDKAIRKVRLDGRIIGEIRELESGFQYFPKGMKEGGKIYPYLKHCIESL